MKQDQNNKLYYKMYKKGRFWIFAGMAVVTMNMSVVTSHADATTQASSEPATSSTSKKSVTSQSQVVLQSSATPSQPSGASDASSAEGVSKTATATSKATATTTAKEQPEKDSETGTQAQSVESSSSSETKSTSKVTTSVVSDVKDTTVTNEETDKLAPVSDEPAATTKPESTLPVENGDTAKKVVTTVEAPVTDLTSENETNEFNNQLTLNKIQETTNNAIGAMAVQNLSRAALVKAATVREVASGNWGTSQWRLTSDGVLTIGSGTLTDGMAPWAGNQVLPNGTKIRAKISKVIIEPNVIAGANLNSIFFKYNNDPGNVPLTDIEGLENLDVSHVTDMYGAFSGDSVSDFSGVKDWDTSNVTDMMSMFSSTLVTDSSKLPIGNWNVGKVDTFNMMFQNTPLTSLDLSHWNVGAGGQALSLGGMFAFCTNLQSLNVSGWNTSHATQIANLVSGDKQLTTLDLSDWDLRSVTGGASALAGTTNLKSLTLNENSRLMFYVKALDYYANVGLPDVPTETKTWQSTTGGDTYTSAQLMALYSSGNSTFPAGKITYVWSPVPKSQIKTKDLTFIAGPDVGWGRKQSLSELIDGNGQNLLDYDDISQWVQIFSVNGDENVHRIDVHTPGLGNRDYSVVFVFTDSYGYVQYATTTVHVLESKASLTVVPETTISVGSQANWNNLTNITAATDEAGNPVTDLSGLAITANTQPDLTKAGDYPVTLTYKDGVGAPHTYTITVHVVENKATITTEPETIVAGPKAVFDLKAAIKGLTDVNGEAVDVDQALADQHLVADLSQLDLSKTGDQLVKVTYTDTTGTSHEATVTVHVVATKADIQANGTTVVTGPSASVWQAADNFVGAKDADGQALTLDDLEVTGNVDTTTPGEYTVTYRYIDKAGNDLNKTVTVKVHASQAAVVAKDATVTAGATAKWTPNDSFVSGTDADGHALTLNDVQVTGTVDMATPGAYTITYQYTDVAGNVVNAKAKVTVVAATDPNTDDNDSTGTGDQIDPDQPVTPTDPAEAVTPATKPSGAKSDQVITMADRIQIDPEQPMSVADKMGTGRILPAKQATESQAKSVSTLPQTDEVQSNSKQALGMTLLTLTGLTGLLGLARKRRHN
ncbi:bacterial Ig-like domain-containing protein [Lactiplantibacillus daoliensis]|uniref:Bacterial Ig-like domain-containing protein n=1 Tax=Lactiplantibacillus daoliensis TaxID=2559916 RepID=A0ABW1UGR6_9LACO|nr:bacterial Ig-like domain-containing protein [Lactiplantibacillus daoliensis]